MNRAVNFERVVRRLAASCWMAACLMIAHPAPAQESPSWQPGFHVRGIGGSMAPGIFPTRVSATAWYNDGSSIGPALYVAGNFESIGTHETHGVARYSNGEFVSVGAGLDWQVGLLSVDASSPPRLIAIGSKVTTDGSSQPKGAAWNGTSWSEFLVNIPEKVGLSASVVAPGPTGPALYFGGISNVIYPPMPVVYRLDGSVWTPVSTSGLTLNGVGTLAYLPLNGVPTLIAGCGYASSPSSAGRFHSWDGSKWNAFGGGLGWIPEDIVSFNDGSGETLFACGSQTLFGRNIVVKWNGSGWVPVGTPSDGIGSDGSAHDLAVLDDGSGPALYAAGQAMKLDNVLRNGVAKWNGKAWSTVAMTNGTLGGVRKLAQLGPRKILACGDFPSIDSVAAEGLATLQSGRWSPVVTSGEGAFRSFDSVGVLRHGSGSRLLAAWSGIDAVAGSVINPFMLEYASGAWRELRPKGAGLSEVVDSFNVLPLTGGDRGFFSLHDNAVLRHAIASWDGTEDGDGYLEVTIETSAYSGWTRFGLLHTSAGDRVHGVGDIQSVAGTKNIGNSVAFDGVSWSAAGGLAVCFPSGTEVPAIVPVSTPTGETLVVWNDRLLDSDEDGACSLSRSWSGTGWTVFDSLPIKPLAQVRVDLGKGPMTYLLGQPIVAGGAGIGTWNGTDWTPIPSALTDHGDGRAPSLADMVAHDDGRGVAIYVTGNFASINGVPANNIARWDGSSWSALGSGTNGPAGRVVSFDDGTGPALFLTGSFSRAGGVISNNFAKWGSGFCKSDLNRDGFVTGDDYDAFVEAFVAGDSAADFNRDGFVNGDDFDEYAVAFEAGC